MGDFGKALCSNLSTNSVQQPPLRRRGSPLKVKELRILAAKKCVPLTQRSSCTATVLRVPIASWGVFLGVVVLRISNAVEKSDLFGSQYSWILKCTVSLNTCAVCSRPYLLKCLETAKDQSDHQSWTCSGPVPPKLFSLSPFQNDWRMINRILPSSMKWSSLTLVPSFFAFSLLISCHESIYHWIDPCSDVVLQLVYWRNFAKVWCQRGSKGQSPESDWMILVLFTKQSVDQNCNMRLVMHKYEILYQISIGT